MDHANSAVFPTPDKRNKKQHIQFVEKAQNGIPFQMNHTHQINTSSNSNSIQLVFENPSDEKKKKNNETRWIKKTLWISTFWFIVYKCKITLEKHVK